MLLTFAASRKLFNAKSTLSICRTSTVTNVNIPAVRQKRVEYLWRRTFVQRHRARPVTRRCFPPETVPFSGWRRGKNFKTKLRGFKQSGGYIFKKRGWPRNSSALPSRGKGQERGEKKGKKEKRYSPARAKSLPRLSTASFVRIVEKQEEKKISKLNVSLIHPLSDWILKDRIAIVCSSLSCVYPRAWTSSKRHKTVRTSSFRLEVSVRIFSNNVDRASSSMSRQDYQQVRVVTHGRLIQRFRHARHIIAYLGRFLSFIFFSFSFFFLRAETKTRIPPLRIELWFRRW